MQCYVRAGPGIFGFRIAFDEAYARYSPGAMLLSSALVYLRDETDAQWIDSCSDRNNEFFLMLPERRRLSMLLIGTGGALDRRIVGALPALSRVNAAQERARARLRRKPADAVSA
jgi:hypothetical protein